METTRIAVSSHKTGGTLERPSDLILRFDLTDQRSPDLETVAEALIAWGNVIRTASAVIDPDGFVKIELAGVDDGSQIFKILLRRIERFSQQVRDGASEYPLTAKAALALAALIASTAGAVVLQNLIEDDPHIPKDQMRVFEKMQEDLAQSVELQRQAQDFYKILQHDPAIKEVELYDGETKRRIWSVPREEFAPRSGLWGDEDQSVYEPRQKFARWDVVLIRAAFVPKPRRWTFARDGLEFSATMVDPQVLAAIQNGKLPIRIAEGSDYER